MKDIQERIAKEQAYAQHRATQVQAEQTARLFGYVKPEQTWWQLLNPVTWLAKFVRGNRAITAPPAPSTPMSPIGAMSVSTTYLNNECMSPDSQLSSPTSNIRDHNTIPLSSVEDLYSGDSGIMSLLIMGQPRDGKSFSARFLIEKLHERNDNKHLLLITKKPSYLNSENVISGISRINQVIWWDCLTKKSERENIVKNIVKKCTDWAKGTTK